MTAVFRAEDKGLYSTHAPLHSQLKPWVHAGAGILGGSISMALFYPLDFLRTRMHIYKGGYKFPLRSARQIVREEGLRGMYKGITVSMFSHGIAWGLYLLTFRAAQQHFFSSGERKVSATGPSGGTALEDFGSACIAAVFTGTAITPLNLLKTRRQLYDMKKYGEPRGIVDGIRAIVKNEGPLSFLRGVGPQILLTGSTTIQVTLYEGIKREVFRDQNNPSFVEVALASAISKAVASTICNPLEVVRTRLQDKQHCSLEGYRSMSAALCTIWRTEGIRGLYRGLPVNICRVIPTTVMTIVLYEKFLVFMGNLHCVSSAWQDNKPEYNVDPGTWIDNGPRE